MKIFGFDIKATQKIPLPQATISKLPAAAGTMYNNPGTVTWQAGNVQSQVKDGYSGNDIVYSIIRLIVDKVKLAPWAEYKIKDKNEFKRYQAIMKRPDLVKDWKKVEKIRTKAIEQVAVSSKITDLINKPNENDSWADLVEAYATFKLITGNAYVYSKSVGFGKNVGKPLELYVLPSQYMSIIADLSKFPIAPTGYQLYMQFTELFNKQEILHDKYFNPNWDIVGNQLYGMSPLQAAARVLTRSNEGKKAAVANYQNGGPKGILFVSDDKHDPQDTIQEAMDLKKTLARNQGSANVNQVETSGYKVDYVPLGLSPVDLDLLNAENLDLRALCNIYQVPSQLLNDPSNKTYNNTSEGEKALTTRCALPMLSSIRDQFNRKFATDWGKMDTVIDFDLSVYQELEEDKAQQISWLKDSYLPLRRRLEIMGESLEGYTDEQLNTIFVPTGVTTIEDVMNGEQPIQLPKGLNDYDQ